MAIVGTATHTIIAEAMVIRIRELNLAGIDDANIALRVFDEELQRCLPGPPGVMVLTAGVELVIQREGGTKTDVISYPVPVIMGDTCGGEDIENVTTIDKHLKWRQDIWKGLWHKAQELRDAGAPVTVCDVEWVPSQIFLPLTWKKRNMWVGAMMFRVKSEEKRP